ncbi:DNA-directed RNA polymerase sigma-70 factor [Planctomycetales bacterium]|nr:DNA-directed RNA polymerase sigma-70 factor [Planctomycetales bacterium]
MFRNANAVMQKKGNTLTTDCQFAELNDEELFAEYRNNQNREAFNQLVLRYERELYGYLYMFIGDRTNAEDVFQTTFIRMMEYMHTFNDGKRFRPWMYQIALNAAKDFLKSRNRFSVVSIDNDFGDGDGESLAGNIEGREVSPSDDFAANDELRRVREAVVKLPEDLRRTLELVYFQGLTYSDTAEILGIAKGSVPGRLNAAVEKLGYILKSENRSEQ